MDDAFELKRWQQLNQHSAGPPKACYYCFHGVVPESKQDNLCSAAKKVMLIGMYRFDDNTVTNQAVTAMNYTFARVSINFCDGGQQQLAWPQLYSAADLLFLSSPSSPPALGARRSFEYAFTLHGEARFGMPWTPLYELNRYADRGCSVFLPKGCSDDTDSFSVSNSLDVQPPSSCFYDQRLSAPPLCSPLASVSSSSASRSSGSSSSLAAVTPLLLDIKRVPLPLKADIRLPKEKSTENGRKKNGGKQYDKISKSATSSTTLDTASQHQQVYEKSKGGEETADICKSLHRKPHNRPKSVPMAALLVFLA